MEKVRQFFDKYLRAYNEHDLDSTVNSFLLPSVMINTNRMAKFNSKEDLLREYTGVFKVMTEQGMARFQLIELNWAELSPTQFVASAQWRVLNGDSTNIMEFGATYALVVEDDELKIATAMVHSQDTVLKLH